MSKIVNYQINTAYMAPRRRQRGLSQQGLADILGVHKSLISHLERGVRPANLELIQRLSRALRCPERKLIL